MMKSLTRWFINGLLAFLPISISLYAVYWIASIAESLLSKPLKHWLGERSVDGTGYYFYGLGVVTMVIILIALGILLEFYLGRLVFRLSEAIMTRIPVVKTIYTTIKDLVNFVSPDKKKAQSNNYMVMVTVLPNIRLIGYVTRDTMEGLKGDLGGPDEVAVVLPFCYQMGGYTLIMPRSMVTPVDLNFEEGMRLALTGFVISPESEEDKESTSK